MSILVLCAALFSLGLYGILVRRDIIGLLASIEVMLGAVSIQFIGWSMSAGIDGALAEAVGVMLLVLAAAESAIGLGLLVTVARGSDRSRIDEMTEVEG
jgi:NADH:ubiquinone oxidoreductase subunit K